MGLSAAYTPATPANWGSPAPSTVQEALDDLATTCTGAALLSIIDPTQVFAGYTINALVGSGHVTGTGTGGGAAQTDTTITLLETQVGGTGGAAALQCNGMVATADDTLLAFGANPWSISFDYQSVGGDLGAGTIIAWGNQAVVTAMIEIGYSGGAYRVANGGAIYPFGPGDAAFHHWLVTYDGTNCSLYIDGTLAATDAITFDLQTMGVGGLQFGASGAYGNPVYGLLNNVNIYSDATQSTQLFGWSFNNTGADSIDSNPATVTGSYGLYPGSSTEQHTLTFTGPTNAESTQFGEYGYWMLEGGWLGSTVMQFPAEDQVASTSGYSNYAAYVQAILGAAWTTATSLTGLTVAQTGNTLVIDYGVAVPVTAPTLTDNVFSLS
jgi:hypothetical protein